MRLNPETLIRTHFTWYREDLNIQKTILLKAIWRQTVAELVDGVNQPSSQSSAIKNIIKPFLLEKFYKATLQEIIIKPLIIPQ